jgi:hypothetical protein
MRSPKVQEGNTLGCGPCLCVFLLFFKICFGGVCFRGFFKNKILNFFGEGGRGGGSDSPWDFFVCSMDEIDDICKTLIFCNKFTIFAFLLGW